MPCPSNGTTSSFSIGFANPTIIKRKKVNVSARIPAANVPVWGSERKVTATAIAETIDNTNVRKSSEPALPAYIATHVYECGIDRLLFSATYLTEKSLVTKALTNVAEETKSNIAIVYRL